MSHADCHYRADFSISSFQNRTQFMSNVTAMTFTFDFHLIVPLKLFFSRKLTTGRVSTRFVHPIHVPADCDQLPKPKQSGFANDVSKSSG